MSLIASLKRRNVFRSALAYVVAAWLLIEVMELITDAFEAPPWVLKVFISLMVIGIVPVMVFSWLYEITPDGIRRETGDGVEHSAATAHRLNITVIVMLAIAIGLFGWQQFGGPPAPAPARESAATVQPAAVTEGPPMVAVLPFASVSMEGDSDFFAVGVHDDLLTQLAKLESLRVISRTSVLEYKNTVHNIRKIGQELGADIILEGGVQAAGGRIRINAQLIDARTDEHLWAETYDRELSPVNIFDVQREIALAITGAMNATLTMQDNQQLTAIPTDNMAAYRAYRRAMDIRHDTSTRGIADPAYVEALREAIALDPAFVRARAELVGALALENVGLIRPDAEIARDVEQHLEQIRAVAPGSGEYLYAQAYYIYYILKDWDQAYDVVIQALARNPSDITILELKSWIERRQGRADTRIETIRGLARLDPRNPIWTRTLILNLLITHHYDAVVIELENTSFEIESLAFMPALMRLRDDGDFQRFHASIEALYQGQDTQIPAELWLARWLNRDDAALAGYLERIDLQTVTDGGGFSHDGWYGLFSYSFLNDPAGLQRFIDLARGALEQKRNESGELNQIGDYVLSALVLAAEGNGEASLETIREWRSLAAADPTETIVNGPITCWVLGLLGASAESVRCLRTHLQVPSYAMPFVDPYLPFFDAMRDDPEFLELMADVESGVFDSGGS